MKVTLIGIIMIISALNILPASAQKWGISTNGMYWLTATPNLGMEYSFHRKMSAAVNLNYNPFSFSNNKKWKHFLGVAEYRYWLSESYKGHYFGAHLTGGLYNAGNLPLGSMRKYRYEGTLFGGGLTYGYQWIVSNRINIGADIGFGYLHLDYNKFDCPTCGEHIDHYRSNYFGPTKIGVNLIYLLK